MGDRDPVPARLGPGHPRPGVDAPAGLRKVGSEGLRDLGEVDDARGRRVESRDSLGVGLDVRNLIAIEAAQARDFVRPPAALELVEALDLRLGGGDDELARTTMGDLPLGAEGVESARALHTQARLQRPRLVVDAGVDDAARMAGLVPPELWLRLEDDDPRLRVSRGQLSGDGRSQDPAADDRQVALRWGL